MADAYALQQAAGTYASDGTWMINIANPDWREQLASIKKAEESNGRYIDRIMIFDHGALQNRSFPHAPRTARPLEKILLLVRQTGSLSPHRSGPGEMLCWGDAPLPIKIGMTGIPCLTKKAGISPRTERNI